ncbi:hypothetical protein COD90_06730 [Bacillus cereus]|nr:hypothetical protein CN431_22195 [Bacillus cereus]PFW85916.1 hypothetical protein COL27_05690 [Bacillus sp. AFS075960]PFI47237.1 hypothetical protein COI76_27030 [Bacillus cereus]PGT88225.1 hypothetical protein COD18_20975 [Bacillus cereus]PGU90937.1 hypothetical protein COD71_19985 [Bacillus cereus]
MLRVKSNNSDGDELPSEGRLNNFVSFVLRYNLSLDKEGIYSRTTKLDNDNHNDSVT